MDAFRHVNNAVYLTYLEEVRDEWLARVLGEEHPVWGYVLARVAIDFRREVTQDDVAVVARISLEGIGTSSVRTREEVRNATGRSPRRPRPFSSRATSPRAARARYGRGAPGLRARARVTSPSGPGARAPAPRSPAVASPPLACPPRAYAGRRRAAGQVPAEAGRQERLLALLLHARRA